MDLLSHASIGLMAKRVTPKAPIWALLGATAVPDIILLGSQAAGIDRPAVTQYFIFHGLQYLSPSSRSLSHGLFMCIVWSVIATTIALMFRLDRRTSAVIGLMVFSHWVADFIFYSDLPLFFNNSPTIGVGLISSGPGFMAGYALEFCLILAGIFAYFYRPGDTAEKDL